MITRCLQTLLLCTMISGGLSNLPECNAGSSSSSNAEVGCSTTENKDKEQHGRMPTMSERSLAPDHTGTPHHLTNQLDSVSDTLLDLGELNAVNFLVVVPRT